MVTVRWASSPFQGSTDPGAEPYIALRANYKQLAKPSQPTAPGFSQEMSRTEHGRTKICHGVTVGFLATKPRCRCLWRREVPRSPQRPSAAPLFPAAIPAVPSGRGRRVELPADRRAGREEDLRFSRDARQDFPDPDPARGRWRGRAASREG